jgi:hypothetical protein
MTFFRIAGVCLSLAGGSLAVAAVLRLCDAANSSSPTTAWAMAGLDGAMTLVSVVGAIVCFRAAARDRIGRG